MIAFTAVLAGCYPYYYEDDRFGRGRPDYGFAHNADPNFGMWRATPPMPQGHMAASYMDHGWGGRSGGYGFMPSPGDWGTHYAYYNRGGGGGGGGWGGRPGWAGSSHFDPCIGDENADMWGGRFSSYELCRQSRWAPRRNPYSAWGQPQWGGPQWGQPHFGHGMQPRHPQWGQPQPMMSMRPMMPPQQPMGMWQQPCHPGMMQQHCMPQPMRPMMQPQGMGMWQPQPMMMHPQNPSPMPMGGSMQAEFPGFMGQQQGFSQNHGGSNIQVTTGGGFVGGGDWIANEGDTLRALLQEWGDRAGWRVVWSSDREYTLEAGAVFRGDFIDVTSALIRAFARATPAPQATFYRGNRVLVINTQESENAD